ncbi:hypothetical protein [Microbacterium halophytorum]|uniref:hypothetical protein n=1 Tax=Microbacterium halophytorum TaxID=2067568 RepID=UPI00131A39F2|nr:hypothetical protein [Microbacterium halophytorum]
MSYIEATNAVNFGDPSTAEPVFDWLTGQALADEREAFSNAHAERASRSGESTVTLFELAQSGDASEAIEAYVCLDVSGVEILNESGDSVVAPDRPNVQSVAVTLVESSRTPTGLTVSNMTGRDQGPSCGN